MYPPRLFKTLYQYLVRRNRKHVTDTIYGDIVKNTTVYLELKCDGNSVVA